MSINFIFSALICLVIALVGIMQGRVTRNYFGPAYRDENPGTFWRYIIFYLIMAVFCFVFGHIEYVNDKDEIEYNYYTVTADPKLSMQETLKSQSPLHQNKITYLSYTQWHVQWNFKWRRTLTGGCQIKNLKVKLTAKVTLPKLIEADDKQLKTFNAYVSQLRAIELGHLELAKNAKYAIKKGMSSLPVMDSCDKLNTQANNIGYQTINEYKTKQQEYDTAQDFYQ